TANDAAIRIARYYHAMRDCPAKRKIISRVNGYHGGTSLTAALTGIHATKVGFAQVGDDFIHHVSAANMYAKPDHLSEEQFCDFLVDEFENRILQLGPDSVAAFIAEPVMGAGGVYVAPKGYHKRMREVCTRYDVLYIADEVVTAFGRLGEWFSSETVFDCTPDIIVCAKGITSGYIPLGATIFSTEIYDVISRPQCEGGVFSMGLTYFGHPVACAAALKNIEIMGGEGMLDNAKTVGPYLQETARSLLNLPIIGDVRGSHLMLGIDLVDDKQAKTPLPVMENAAERILQKCIQRGVIVRPVGSRLVISPPLIITKEECDTLIGVVSEAIMEFVSERPASQAAE
ncbi:MAG: aminotransferase class III-fold pyridoxal phosphate-dependent enzyme, partial [Pseudomonadota bacterium]